jgi:hypothetical protein
MEHLNLIRVGESHHAESLPLNRSAAVSQTSRSRVANAATGFQHSRAPIRGKELDKEWHYDYKLKSQAGELQESEPPSSTIPTSI